MNRFQEIKIVLGIVLVLSVLFYVFSKAESVQVEGIEGVGEVQFSLQDSVF